MNKQDLNEIMEILGPKKELFYYHKDRFALNILKAKVGCGLPVSDLRTGPEAPLLNRPEVKKFLASLGDGLITQERIDAWWPESHDCYVMTLGQWGEEDKTWSRSYEQMARPGYNLVLQMNFTREHDSKIQPIQSAVTDFGSFNYSLHPITTTNRTTLAWARLDLDLTTGEVLIEELQSDFIRRGQRRYTAIFSHHKNARNCACCLCETKEEMEIFYQHYFLRHAKQWQEAMMEATLAFCRTDLGMRDIYLYSYETGLRIKGNKRTKVLGSRQLYEKLPKQFGFEKQVGLPTYLAGDKAITKSLRQQEPVFWTLAA